MNILTPEWPAPKNVRSLQTTRHGGVSGAPYASLNLGDHVGDAPLAVERNRMLLEPLLPSEPVWLKQVHGVTVTDAAQADCWPEHPQGVRRWDPRCCAATLPQADACVSAHPGAVCVVMTADCLPVLLCDDSGSVVGAVHAGWRGLCDGVIEQTVQAMKVPPTTLMAWLGPAIGAKAFEVGDEVRAAFVARQPQAAAAFTPSPPTGFAPLATLSPQAGEGGAVVPGEGKKWLADIYQLARLRLHALGITRIYGGGLCTYTDSARFFSYRRDGATGRMGTFIWLAQ